MNIYIAVAIPVIIAFLLSVALGPVIIPFLRKLKFGQTVRDDGPQGSKNFWERAEVCELTPA